MLFRCWFTSYYPLISYLLLFSISFGCYFTAFAFYWARIVIHFYQKEKLTAPAGFPSGTSTLSSRANTPTSLDNCPPTAQSPSPKRTETIDGWEEEAVLVEGDDDEDIGWETGSEDVMNSPASSSRHSNSTIARATDEVPDCPELTGIPGWSVGERTEPGDAST